MQATGTPADAQKKVEELEEELSVLQTELLAMRRRDEALNMYMGRLDEELRLAARLQRDFLPKSLPQVGPAHFHTLFRPASYVSGDIYDVMRLDEKHVGFYVADAVGHGMPAALLTMFIKRALETKDISDKGYRLLRPSESMQRLNDALTEQQLSQATFATALYGMIDLETLQVTFARGGHPNPIVLRGAGALNVPEADGCLLGINAGEQFPDASVQLELGDRLFIYSDGIEIAFADDMQNNTGQWRNELERRRDMSTEQLLRDFANCLDRESGSLRPRDDLTLIVLDVK